MFSYKESLNPLIEEVAQLLKKANKPFWLAGGYSLDLLVGKKTREHEDLDFIISRQDQLIFQKTLSGWELQAADPPGTGNLFAWPPGHFYELPIHNIWCRKNETSPWNLEILFSEFENDEWVYRRNKTIRGPLSNFAWQTESGLMVLAPEIQLLYKSRSKRPKDFQDLESVIPFLTAEQKEKLIAWIALDSGSDHPWLDII
ncbi:MAG: amino acid transporter [Bdellovibrio sp.]|nr:amino acid transporter [Bdellovibrio sp.]